MVEETVNKMGLTESFASKLAMRINKERGGSRIDYLKMKLGIEMLVINLTKSFIVYGVAIAFHILLQTLILHAAYFAIRRVAFGLHANSSTICTIISVLAFVGTPILCQYIWFNNYLVIGLGVILTLLLYRYAPADTDKYPLLGVERRNKMRKEAVITCIIIMIIALICPSPMIKSLLVCGVLIQVVAILPVSYKLLKRSFNNYEKYEASTN